MLGFLSKEKDKSVKVKNEEIFFISVPNGLSIDEIKMIISPKAKLFADKFNVNTVYLYCGKDLIIYEFKI